MGSKVVGPLKNVYRVNKVEADFASYTVRASFANRNKRKSKDSVIELIGQDMHSMHIIRNSRHCRGPGGL